MEGVGKVVILQLVSTVLFLGLRQLAEWRYGAMGIVCLVVLGAGIRARSSTWTSIGAIILVLLMIQA